MRRRCCLCCALLCSGTVCMNNGHFISAKGRYLIVNGRCIDCDAALGPVVCRLGWNVFGTGNYLHQCVQFGSASNELDSHWSLSQLLFYLCCTTPVIEEYLHLNATQVAAHLNWSECLLVSEHDSDLTLIYSIHKSTSEEET